MHLGNLIISAIEHSPIANDFKQMHGDDAFKYWLAVRAYKYHRKHGKDRTRAIVEAAQKYHVGMGGLEQELKRIGVVG